MDLTCSGWYGMDVPVCPKCWHANADHDEDGEGMAANSGMYAYTCPKCGYICKIQATVTVTYHTSPAPTGYVPDGKRWVRGPDWDVTCG